jgi:predicted glycosyltransferase involved in capsule biosynthesis
MSYKNYIIIPYRNRLEHLKEFIPYYSKLLNNIEIIIIEQDDINLFNRGILMNIGFDISRNNIDNKYFTFHDVDMLYIGDDVNNIYSYPKNPTHIATACEQFDYKMPYKNYFGGVCLFNEQDFLKINGFSNSFIGWGAEDDNLLFRIKNANITINRINDCKYKSLSHDRDINKDALKKNRELQYTKLDDGLSTLKYEITSIEKITNISTKYKVKI